MIIRLSNQKKEFIQGWIACRNWGMAEAHPDCPYEWGYTEKENAQFGEWRKGFSACLGVFSRGVFQDDIPDELINVAQLDLFD